MKSIGVFVALLFSSSAIVHANESRPEYQNLSNIEQALNPLDFMANHDGIKHSINLNIQFAVNSARLLDSATDQLKILGQALNGKRLNNCQIQLTGHTDATGNAKLNLILSDARAKAVKEWLVTQAQVTATQLSTSGSGETTLLAGLAESDAKHRRVEVSLVDVKACRESMASTNSQTQSNSQEKVKIEW